MRQHTVTERLARASGRLASSRRLLPRASRRRSRRRPVPVGRLAPSREPSSGRSANRPGAGHVCEQDRRTGIASQRHISRNFQPQADKDPAQVGNSRRSLMTWRKRVGPAHPPIRTCWKPAYRAPNRRDPRRTPWRHLTIRHIWSWALVTGGTVGLTLLARPGLRDAPAACRPGRECG